MSTNEPHVTSYRVFPSNPPNDGIMFVDHSQAGRSGHLGHALVEYEPNKILAFYPNCSADRGGHTADGWMEYKRSEDGGHTWSASSVLPYSRQIYEERRGRAAMSEKAVRTSDGTIVLFNLISDISVDTIWEPYWVPTYLRSTDGGQSWGAASELGDQRGRVYDAIAHDGSVLALKFCNDAASEQPNPWTGNRPEHVYELHVSSDQGRTFTVRSQLPFDTRGRGYGTMEVLHDGALIACVYNVADEYNLDYVVSRDGGYSWSDVQRAFLGKKIRNPQLTAFGDGFVLHGRSGAHGDGSGHFVLYTSQDGMNWDAGTYLRMQDAGAGAYSNSIVVGKLSAGVSPRLLIQASHAYKEHMTNILHWWIL